MHALYGLPGGLIQGSVDTHDGKPGGGWKRKRKKKEPEPLIKRGVGELRIVGRDDYKFSIREALRQSDLRLDEDEEEFMIMLLMGDYDD